MKQKKLMRKTFSVITALSVLSSVVVLPITTSTPANAGMVSNIVTGKWGAVGMELFKKTTMRALGAAANHAENDTVASILTKTKSLLTDPTSRTLGEIKNLCYEMNEKPDDISNMIDDNQKELIKKLNGIASSDLETQFKDKKEALKNINDHNLYIIGVFNEFSNAVDAADIDKKDTIKTLAEKYEALMKIYDAPNGITTRTTMTFNYADDAQSIANLISTYSPTKNLQENIKNGVDVGDKSGWGESSGSDTIITTFYKLLPYYDAFDHEYFRDMTAQYNYALGIVANYMESYNLYVSYAAQLIYAGAIDDLDVNERSKQMKVDGLWKDYDECCYMLMRALAQMVDEYDSKFSGIMREYDVNTSIHFDNVKDSIKGSNIVSGVTGQYRAVFESKKNKTSNRMQAYQMRPFGSTTAYALRKTNSSQPAVKMEDLTYHAFNYMIDSIPFYQHECNGYSCDYYNLLKSGATSPTGWNPLSKNDQLNGLVNTTAFENIGDGSDSDIIKYLKAHGMTSDLPKIDGSNPYTPSTNYDWNYEAGGYIANWDIDMKFYNVSGLKKGSSMGETTYDMDDDQKKFKGKEASIFYTGEPQVAVYLPSNSGAQYQYSAVDYKGSNTSANGGRNVLRSGGTITLRVKPDEGKYIKSLRLCDRFVYDEDHSKGTLTQYISEDDALYKSNCGIYPESDGYYTFKINVPFRDGSVILDLGDVPTKIHTVELVESDPVVNNYASYDLDSGILSFADFTGEKAINTNTGDTVSVAVLPYTKYTCTGIEVRDSDGNLYDYSEVNPSEYFSIVHGQKNFSFNVPDADVTVKAVYTDSYNVELISDELSSLNFINDIGTVDESADIRSFEPGETVKLKVTAKSGNCISSITVSDYTNREYIACKLDGSDVSFIMPEGNVIVESVGEKMVMEKYVASVLDRDKNRIELVNSSGNPINVSSVQVTPGDSVYFKTTSNNPVVKDKDKNNVHYTLSNGIYSFVMPESNTEISAVVSSASITDGSALKFLDEDGNTVEDKTLYYSYGEQVRFVTDGSPCNYSISARSVSGTGVSVQEQPDGTFMISMPGMDIIISSVNREPPVHNYENGICTRCGHFEAPSWSSDIYNGGYQIRNAGNLFWLASLVNDNNKDLADYNRDTSQFGWSDASILNDIDLENRPWTPLGSFGKKYEGSIRGNNHSIKNINMSFVGEPNGGDQYFGFISELSYSMLSNLRLSGTANLKMSSGTGKMYYGSVAGLAYRGSLDHVFSYIDVNAEESNGSNIYAGGICGFSDGGNSLGYVVGCANLGSIKGNISSAAGIVNKVSNSCVRYSANVGDIDTTQAGSNAVVAGIAADVTDNNTSDTYASKLEYGYNYGKLACSDSSHIASVMYSTGSNTTPVSFYHLSGTEGSRSTEMSEEQFKSGEVGYKVNNGASTGNYLYYQNIDNGRTPGDYALPDSSYGVIYYIQDENRYSNYPDGNIPTVDLSIDTDQFAYDGNGNKTSYVVFADTDSTNATVNIGSDVSLNYFEDETHHLESLKAVGQNSGRTDYITFSNGTASYHIGEEAVIFVPTFVEFRPDTVKLSFDTEKFIYNDNGSSVAYVTFSVTNSYDTLTAKPGTDVMLVIHDGGNYTLNSLTAVGQNTGRTESVSLSDNPVIFTAWDEDVMFVPEFVEVTVDSQPVNVSIDTDAFIYDENGEPKAYITFGDTDSFDPITVDPDTEVTLTVHKGGCEFYSLMALGQSSGDLRYVPIDSDTIVYKIWDEDVKFIPEFEEPEQPVDEPAEEVAINTYDQLVEFAENVQNDNAKYGKAHVWLESNIIAPEDSSWTVPIGTSANTFTGVFDGRGFGIVGLNVSVDDFGGLFGYIGTNGIVKDLAVIDCDFTKRSNCAGGIAAVNNGTIDHCLSGVNIDSSVVIYGKNGKKLRPSEYNSYVNGKYAGGVAGANNGKIIGTRNGAVVYGEWCGGITAGNFGTIYGCANNGAVGRDSVSVMLCGGLTALNSGVIGSSYNSGKPMISSAQETTAAAGMIAAKNETDTISNTFCNSINAVPPLGSGDYADPDGMITVITNTLMLDPSFADTLNAVTDETVQWEQKIVNGTYLNSLYPVILGSFLKNRTITLSNGISLRGLMHEQLNVSCDETEDNSEIYNVFSSALPNRKMTVYNVSCDDGSDGFVPADFWCSGVSISVPVDSNDVTFAVLGSDGTVRLVEPESIENGIAAFPAASPVSFAVVSTASAEPGDNNSSEPGNSNVDPRTDGNNSGSDQYSGNGNVQTGEAPTALMAFVMMLISAAAVVFMRRKKNRE